MKENGVKSRKWLLNNILMVTMANEMKITKVFRENQ